MFAKLSKCAFAREEIEYLGHVITGQGVAAEDPKVKCMVEWPTPTTVRSLRGFLGLTGYYRKFIKGYGLIAKPLTQLLKKGGFEWKNETDAAFKELEKALTTTPVLAMPNFT